MKEQQTSRPARLIGSTLAHAQNTIDILFKIGIVGLRKVGEIRKNEKPKNLIGKAVHAGATVLGFLGLVGKSYFDEYEKLKRKP